MLSRALQPAYSNQKFARVGVRWEEWNVRRNEALRSAEVPVLPSLTEGVDVEEANIRVGERGSRRPGDIDEASSGLIREGKSLNRGDVRIVEEGNVISTGLVVDGLLGVLLPEHVVKKTVVESQGGVSRNISWWWARY